MMLYTHDCVFCIHNECIFHILFVLFYKINESIYNTIYLSEKLSL